jgi:hypothetical protein
MIHISPNGKKMRSQILNNNLPRVTRVQPAKAKNFANVKLWANRLLWVATLCTISGCTPRMSNDEIIKQTKYCESNGLKAETLSDFNGVISVIQCAPRSEK